MNRVRKANTRPGQLSVSPPLQNPGPPHWHSIKRMIACGMLWFVCVVLRRGETCPVFRALLRRHAHILLNVASAPSCLTRKSAAARAVQISRQSLTLSVPGPAWAPWGIKVRVLPLRLRHVLRKVLPHLELVSRWPWGVWRVDRGSPEAKLDEISPEHGRPVLDMSLVGLGFYDKGGLGGWSSETCRKVGRGPA